MNNIYHEMLYKYEHHLYHKLLSYKMKYPLENAVITNDFPIGISNEFLGEEAEVSVEDGELVCMIRYYEDEV